MIPGEFHQAPAGGAAFKGQPAALLEIRGLGKPMGFQGNPWIGKTHVTIIESQNLHESVVFELFRMGKAMQFATKRERERIQFIIHYYLFWLHINIFPANDW